MGLVGIGAEVTARFQVISKVVINIQVCSGEYCCHNSICSLLFVVVCYTIQNALLARPSTAVIGASIRRLQKHEGSKLVIVAAQHMDLIIEKYPAFAPHMGKGSVGGRLITNKEYNAQKKEQCENGIREEMENIMSEKCDLVLIDSDSTTPPP